MNMRSYLVVTFLLAAGLSDIVLPAHAQNPEKTFTIIVGSAAGGSYDTSARLLARHLGRHLPGHPSVIVKNLPGAASMTAIRSLDLDTAKNGSTIVAFQSGLIGQSRRNPEEVPFDFRKYAWVGTMTDDLAACYVWKRPGITSIEDARNAGKKLHFGASGIGINADLYARILRNLFGVPVEIVYGYKSGTDVGLAIERGEIDGQCSSWGSIPVDWLDNNRVTILYKSAAKTPSTGSALKVPNMMDLAANERDRSIVKALVFDREISGPYITSPDVPAERLKMLRDAFDKTMQDPDFLADAEKEKQPIGPKTAAQAVQIVETIYAIPDDIIEAARNVTK